MPQRVRAGAPGYWIAAAATAAAALAVWVTLRADFLAYPGWVAAQKADLILGPVFVGLYWLRRRPSSRFGPLLIVAGLVGGVPYILQSHPQEIESAVYFCGLEALQNATKHAGPTAHIAARLTAEDGELRLEVSDDGPGFDVGAVRSGYGPHNMEDRLGAVHGRLAIISSPGNGTLISAAVPLNGAAP